MDLFEWKRASYLIVVDYFSRYVEISKLCTTIAAGVIANLKSIFARHGIPEVVVSDNGSQFTSATFAEFAQSYAFAHLTTSRQYSQSNGEAERAVKTVKCTLKKAGGPYPALLSHGTIPITEWL